MQSFQPLAIQTSRADGYFIEAFPFRSDEESPPHVIAYGLGGAQVSVVTMFLNPFSDNAEAKDWDQVDLARLRYPVGMTYADITGNGLNDVIITDEYGPSMDDLWMDGGRIIWLQNPGNSKTGNWRQRFIGRSPSMHRVKAGHFTTRDRVQVAGFPIIVRAADRTSPAPVVVYTAPEFPENDNAVWEEDIAFPDSFRLVHDVDIVKSFDGGLDKILIAGREGVTLLWYDEAVKTWMSKNLGSGGSPSPGNPYWGSGCVALGKVRLDTSGFIGTAEGFHGNRVAVYVKNKDDQVGEIANANWNRYVLHDFGDLNARHEGYIHHVICADIDGDGDDELLVACMGSNPPSWERTGVWCYKPVDLETGKFAKFKLSDDSAARIAVANFRSSYRLDFATISYSVPGYFESPSPSVILHTSSFITASRLNEEVVFRVPRPTDTRLVDEVAFLDVATRKLSLVVVPPWTQYCTSEDAGLKILAGRVFWTDKNETQQERTQATNPFGVISTIVDAQDGHIFTQAEGAVFLLMTKSTTSGKPPYSDMAQLKAQNTIPPQFSSSLQHMDFPWVKVQDRPWANGRFKDLEFYNLTGFHVRYADDSDQTLCHMQLWTAGVGVSAGFHNHVGEPFCEIHACIINGTGKGGMHWATVSDGEFNPSKPESGKTDSVVVSDMYEHGPLWRTRKDGLPNFRDNGTVDYPWHAWIAGGKTQDPQAFDVWVAFEFPPLISHTVQSEAKRPQDGTYRLVNTSTNIVATIKDGDSTDGAPIVTQRSTGGEEEMWQVETVPGTNLFTITNSASTSKASAAWPPVANQTLVGTRSPALLNTTSLWTIVETNNRFSPAYLPNYLPAYSIQLVGTSLAWAMDDKQVVLMEASMDHVPHWRLVPRHLDV
ncbi:hypothetical protein F5878DRAFT_619848 [Lentinula raphanica]|uniref:Aldos-2-ulose dehydratase/isomerase (AUDH) Cupin domain-containing protein n=1 Tax=Lentinula raphanica TaxID=153919 RepID=A0AA38P8L6_9AGAR|nr:hypothetical protein F5880DRAFT_45517 [Lentinula raphanica]KAJ3838342.1 hypothetical protein F5878DRAFT_619848 [Lentinula raphanica]